MAERTCNGSRSTGRDSDRTDCRGADQSFWGAEIPYHINPRYEARKERKQSDAPGPGVYWWHTAEDTFDKIDFDGLMRDGAVVRSLLCGLLNEEMLPADFSEYFHTWNGYLEPLKILLSMGKKLRKYRSS